LVVGYFYTFLDAMQPHDLPAKHTWRPIVTN
jgi:hypothetical protein